MQPRSRRRAVTVFRLVTAALLLSPLGCDDAAVGTLFADNATQAEAAAPWEQLSGLDEPVILKQLPPPKLGCPVENPSDKACNGCVLVWLTGGYAVIYGLPLKHWGVTLEFEGGVVHVTADDINPKDQTVPSFALPPYHKDLGDLVGGEARWLENAHATYCCDEATGICYEYYQGIPVRGSIIIPSDLA
jgi:hypothetical protein